MQATLSPQAPILRFDSKNAHPMGACVCNAECKPFKDPRMGDFEESSVGSGGDATTVGEAERSGDAGTCERRRQGVVIGGDLAKSRTF